MIFDTVNECYHSLSKESSFVLSRLRDGMEPAEIESAFSAEFPQHAGDAGQAVSLIVEALGERELWGTQSHSILSAPVDRRQVLKIGGATVLATIAAAAPAAAFSGSLKITQAFWVHDAGAYSASTTVARCGATASINALFDVTNQVRAVGATDTSTGSSITLTPTGGPGGTPENLGDPSGSGPENHELFVDYTCAGVAQPRAFICAGATQTLTCP